MSIFKSEKFVQGTGVNLDVVAEELAEHFRERKYEVTYSQVDERTWDVSITRGGMFKQAVGLKSALKIEMEMRPKGTYIRAGAGVFGKQAVPTVISMFVAWPVILPQVWGLIRESGLDDEAVKVVEVSINRMLRSSGATVAGPADRNGGGHLDERVPSSSAGSPGMSTLARFCPKCGADRAPGARFCASCGAARDPAQA
jgi:zinc-ribbon domain